MFEAASVTSVHIFNFHRFRGASARLLRSGIVHVISIARHPNTIVSHWGMGGAKQSASNFLLLFMHLYLSGQRYCKSMKESSEKNNAFFAGCCVECGIVSLTATLPA